MKLTTTGLTIDYSAWRSARPYPSDNEADSAIAVCFDNAPAVVLSEKFLLHAIGLLLHDASTLNPRPACVARIQDALTMKKK